MAKKKKRLTPKSPAPARAAAPSPSPLPGWARRHTLHMGGLFLMAILLYANTLRHDYALDDAIVITDNMFTQEGIRGIPGISAHDTFYGFFKEEGKTLLVAGGRYRPLSLLTFALEWEFWGRNPAISHFINALLYGLTGVLLYLLLLSLFQASRQKFQAYFVALTASAIFVAHPLHTEVVANIKGRDELLALIGALGALYLLLRASQHRRSAVLSVLAAVVFFLGLMAKENAITFLAVIPLAFYYFTNVNVRRLAMLMAPLLLAALTFLFIRGGIIGWQFGSPSNELMNNPFLKLVGDRYVPFSASEKLATVTFTLGKYLQLLFWPWPLTHDYYPRHIELMHWNDGRVLLSVLAYLALLLIALRGLARKTPLSFAIFYYLITLSIVSNLVFAVGTNMAERLLFMPSAGYSLALGLLLYRLAQTPKSHAAPVRSWYPALSVAVLLCVVYGALTIKRNPVWKNNYTLFSSDIVVSPNSAKLRNALGGETIAQAIQLDEREEARKTAMLSEAIEHLQEAARIHPHYKNAYLLLGNAHYFLRRYEEAIAYYQKALARDPNYREANNNLAIAYRDAGRYQGEQLGNLDRAIQYLEQAYQMQPGEYENVRLLGVAHGIKGNTRQAIEFFEKAAQLAPDNADAWYNLGSAYYNAGQPERGRQYQERAKEIDPEITRRMDQPQ